MEDINLEELHLEAMEKIEEANDFRELPKISKIMLLTRLKGHFKDDKIESVENGDLVEVANALIKERNVDDSIRETLERLEVEEDDIEELFESIQYSISQDYPLKNMVEELNAKDEKIRALYDERHEETMKTIEEAENLEDLPKNRTTSSLTSYLSQNSSVYVEGVTFTPSDFKGITEKLLSGKRIEDEEIQDSLVKIAYDNYPEDGERISKLLIEKIGGLPNTYHLVEEINRKNEKDEEILGKGLKNVNIYYLPIINPNAPYHGGSFYACYVNTGKVLGMDNLLPEIREKELRDPKAIEVYIRDNYDPTFKISGANILGKGYKINEVFVGGELITTPKEEEKEEDKGESSLVTISREEYEEYRRLKAFYERMKSAEKEVGLIIEVEDEIEPEEEIKEV